MKAALIPALAAFAAAGYAQVPDLFINIDARMQFLTQKEGPTYIRFYDNLGRHSTASVTFFTEIGFTGFVSQKFERIPHDADHDQLDQYYVEDEGLWRLGKQYLPFGAGRFLHESALAARGDLQWWREDLPITIALCDSGPGRQRGVVGRIGSRLGFSFAVGSHFGINGTSFDLIRRPEDSPGVGHGYRQVFGMDYAKNAGDLFEIGGEAVLVRGGHTPTDRDDFMFDVYGKLKADPNRTLTLGWTRDNAQAADIYRAMGQFVVSRNLVVEPMVRYKAGGLYDAAVTMHFKF